MQGSIFPKKNLIHTHIFLHIKSPLIISRFYSSTAYFYQKKHCLYPKSHGKVQKKLCNSNRVLLNPKEHLRVELYML